jgi:quinol monooxygenase YgiN
MNTLYRSLLLLLSLGLTLISGTTAQQAWAQQAAAKPSGNIYVVTYVDIVPNLLGPEVLKILQEFAADSKKEPGCLRFEVLQQTNRLNHLTLVSVWQTLEAFDAHSGTANTRRFREKLQPFIGSPFDERLHSLLP